MLSVVFVVLHASLSAAQEPPGEYGTLIVDPAVTPATVLIHDNPVAESLPALEQPGFTVVAPGALAISPQPQPLQANGLVVPAGYECPSEGHCGTPCPACRQARYTGWSAMAELLSFQPSYSSSGYSTLNAPSSSAGMRFQIGHEASDGRGATARFASINFEDMPTVVMFTVEPLAPTSIETFLFDFDLTQRLWIGDTSLVLGAGPRFAHLSIHRADLVKFDVNAGGIGGSLVMNRPLWRGETAQLSAIGRGGASLLGGGLIEAGKEGNKLADSSMLVADFGFGVEWRDRSRWGDLYLRLMAESQWWDTTFYEPVVLNGLSLSFGHQW